MNLIEQPNAFVVWGLMGFPASKASIAFARKGTSTFFAFFAKSVKYDSVYKQKGNPGTRHDRAEGAFFETCTRFLLLPTFTKVANPRTQKDQNHIVHWENNENEYRERV